MQTGAADAIRVRESAYGEVVFVEDRTARGADADVLLCVQPPALAVVDAMKPGAILLCFVHAANEPERGKRLLARKITCFASASRASRARTRWTRCRASRRWRAIMVSRSA